MRCSETDLYMLTIILRFLLFKIWSILYSRFLVKLGQTNSEKKIVLKGASPPKVPSSWELTPLVNRLAN